MSLNSSLKIGPSGRLAQLLLAYTPKAQRQRATLALAIDEKLANALRAAREPTLAAIRLAWWRDVLVHDDPSKGQGEPLVAAWRDWQPDAAARQNAGRLIDGWTALADREAAPEDIVRDFGQARGTGLFSLMSGADTAAVSTAGYIWALWDLAGHVEDHHLAVAAMAAALGRVDEVKDVPSIPETRPVRLALAAALSDVQQQKVPEGGFAPRHYFRLVRASLFG